MKQTKVDGKEIKKKSVLMIQFVADKFDSENPESSENFVKKSWKWPSSQTTYQPALNDEDQLTSSV